MLVGGGVGMVLEGGMLADALLEADALLLAEALTPLMSTGVSSLAGSSYGYTSQATPEVPSEAVPIDPSNPLGSGRKGHALALPVPPLVSRSSHSQTRPVQTLDYLG